MEKYHFRRKYCLNERNNPDIAPYCNFFFLYRTKDDFRNGASRNSYNTDRTIVTRHGQVQDRSVQKSSHGSTTWNCRSGNGNYSSEQRRNSVNFDFLPLLNDYDVMMIAWFLWIVNINFCFVLCRELAATRLLRISPYFPSCVECHEL